MPVPEEEMPPIVRPRAEELKLRQIKIRFDVELQAYGYTEGCAGCDAAISGTAPRNHSQTCRDRIDASILAESSSYSENLRVRQEARALVNQQRDVADQHADTRLPLGVTVTTTMEAHKTSLYIL